jgi:hypothetical protein
MAGNGFADFPFVACTMQNRARYSMLPPWGRAAPTRRYGGKHRMKKLCSSLPMLLLLLGLVAGCGDSGAPSQPAANSGGGSPDDEAAIASEAALQSAFIEDGFYESSDQVPLGLAGLGGSSLQSAIDPIAFWRVINRVERRFEFAIDDTTAVVTLHKHLFGSFNILVPDTTGAFERTVIRKRLVDDWERRLLFKRVDFNHDRDKDDDDEDEDDDGATSGEHRRPRWKLAAVSGVKVSSVGPEMAPALNIVVHVPTIVSLRIEYAGVDSTITDPLAFVRLRGLPVIEPGTQVRLTATTMAPDDVVLLLRRNHRLRLWPNGDNTYTGEFTVPGELGCHHFGVNALSHGTLYDDQVPYQSQAWILPYLVKGTELAADIP